MMRGVWVVAAFAAVSGCGGQDMPDDQMTGSIDSAAWERARSLSPELQEALDSGNAAFRREEFDAARAHYVRATELGPEASAGWFGLSMVERRMGNIEAAEAAMQRVQALSPGASLVHPDTSDDLPPGHP